MNNEEAHPNWWSQWARVRTEQIRSTAVNQLWQEGGYKHSHVWCAAEREDSSRQFPFCQRTKRLALLPMARKKVVEGYLREEEGEVCAVKHVAGAYWGHMRCLNSLRLENVNFYKLTLKPLFDYLLLFLITVSGFCTWKYKPVLNQHPTLNSFLPGFFPKMLLFPHFTAPPL